MGMKSFPFNRIQLIWTIVIVFLFFFGMSLRRPLSDNFRLTRQRHEVIQEVEVLELTRQALEGKLTEVSSDKAVEDWARGQAHMIKPGDVLVIPLAGGGFTPTPVPAKPKETVKYANWEVWWALFFD